MARVRVGVSGWTYEGWAGAFYPAPLANARRLEYASRAFGSIEVNATFYRLQRPETFADWRRRTGPDFVFAIKGSRFLTHNKKLGDVDAPLANFFAQGLLRLEEKLGPILWQLPASARFDADRLRTFIAALPRDTAAAAKLARGHDARLDGRAWTDIERKRRIRHAFEVRHPSFLDEEFVRIARDAGVAIVASHARDWPYIEELTAGFVYVRLHGPGTLYASGYAPRAIQCLASRILAWRAGGEPGDARRITDRAPPARKGRDVYVYFDNDQKALAPRDARALAAQLDLAHRLPDPAAL
ncbi:MAG: DUF72 domain-containing protein [Longimicrobiales bacterium]